MQCVCTAGNGDSSSVFFQSPCCSSPLRFHFRKEQRMVGEAWGKWSNNCVLECWQVPVIARRALAAVVRACVEWGQRHWGRLGACSSSLANVSCGGGRWWVVTLRGFSPAPFHPGYPPPPFHSGVCIQSQVHRIRRGRWAQTCAWRPPHRTLCQCWAAVGNACPCHFPSPLSSHLLTPRPKPP